jgi:hypothetical protein
MNGPDLERQELARDLTAVVAKAMRDIAVLARVAARMADEGYSLSQAANALFQLTGKRRERTILGHALLPLAENARTLCDRDRLAVKVRRRLVKSAVDQGGVDSLPTRKKPPAGGEDDPPRVGA